MEGSQTLAEQRARWDATGSYFTPPPVVQQGLQSHARVQRPARILDLCAGAGVFSMVARETFPGAFIAAVEIRPEEGRHLDRWCDLVLIGDALALRRELADHRFDLVIGNPDYRWGVELTELALSLRPAAVLLLHRGTFGDSARALDLLERHRPECVLTISGRPQWRLELESADWIRHVWFRWGRRPAAQTILDWLPPLGATRLTWIERPGTQPRPPPPLPDYLLIDPPPLETYGYG